MGQFLVRFSLWYSFGFTNSLPYVLFLRYAATKRNDETIFFYVNSIDLIVLVSQSKILML
jgi:hypothetical protein